MLVYIFATTISNRECKSFSLSLLVCQLNFLRTSKGLSLGELICLHRIYFPNTFALILDSNLHDSNGTNPDWRCFQQNCHGVVYCAQNKISRNDLKIHGDYFWKISKILAKESRPGAHTLSTRVGGAPALPGRAPCLMGPLELHRPQLQLYIFVFGEKK